MKTVQSLKQRGFTLVELLIVIAVLGVLAVAVLSAINPIEQINRGRDTGGRSDAEQLINAIDRYYTSQGYYPWQTGPTDTSVTQAWTAVNGSWSDSGGAGVLTKLAEGTVAGTGEVKASFTTRISAASYNTMYVYNAGTQGTSTYVCFNPKSASFKAEAKTRCEGSLPSDYPPAGSSCKTTGTDPYYSCLP